MSYWDALAGNTVTERDGSGERAGARTLNMLAAPLNARILRALRNGSEQQVALRRETGHPAQSTLRTQMKKLCEAGAIEKRQRNRFPGVLDYELSDAGRDLLPVIDDLERWLRRNPEGALTLDADPAKAGIKALAEAWSTTMLRALAAKPLALTEIDRLITSLNYPSLERRLAAMRLTGLVSACESASRATPYRVTEWGRHGVAPLLRAAAWERCHQQASTPPLRKLDIETVFMLAAFLVQLPSRVSGSCQLKVLLEDAQPRQAAGCTIDLRDGRVAACATQLTDPVDSWASGPAWAWLAAATTGEINGLEFGGALEIAESAVAGLHTALFAMELTD